MVNKFQNVNSKIKRTSGVLYFCYPHSVVCDMTDGIVGYYLQNYLYLKHKLPEPLFDIHKHIKNLLEPPVETKLWYRLLWWLYGILTW